MPASSSSTSGGTGGGGLNSFDANGGNFGGHPFGSGSSFFGPQPAVPPAAVPSPSISVQLYDEFVSRGNVAVLKCLVISVATNLAAAAAAVAISPKNVHQGSPSSSAKMLSSAPLYPSSAYHYSRENSFVSSSSSSSSSSSFFPSENSWWADGSGSGSGSSSNFLASEFSFEWRIKNGPAASAATGETILSLRSNQTQGKRLNLKHTFCCLFCCFSWHSSPAIASDDH